MEVSMIVAHAKDRSIGKDGELPWHLPDDLRWFKTKTINHIIVMGRKTWDTFGGKPLPKRHHVVITRNKKLKVPKGVTVLHDVPSVLSFAKEQGEKELFITGGQQIYEMFLPFASKLYVTEVATTVENADAFFPDFLDLEWETEFRAAHAADDRHAHSFVFNILERKD